MLNVIRVELKTERSYNLGLEITASGAIQIFDSKYDALLRGTVEHVVKERRLTLPLVLYI